MSCSPPGTSGHGNRIACQCRRCRECWLYPWVRKVPSIRKWQFTPVFCPEKSYGQRSLAGYSPWDGRVGHDLTSKQQQLIGFDFNLSILLLFCVCVIFVLFSSFSIYLNRLDTLDDFMHLFCWLMRAHSLTVLMVSEGFITQSLSVSQSTFKLYDLTIMWKPANSVLPFLPFTLLYYYCDHLIFSGAINSTLYCYHFCLNSQLVFGEICKRRKKIIFFPM